jgi:hypothetical protein
MDHSTDKNNSVNKSLFPEIKILLKNKKELSRGKPGPQ